MADDIETTGSESVITPETAPETAPETTAPAKAKAPAKAPRKRTAKAPDPEPVIPVIVVRQYNPWTAPTDAASAKSAMTDPKGVTHELARAQERVRRNIAKYPVGVRKDGTPILWHVGMRRAEASGATGAKATEARADNPLVEAPEGASWHDRTVTKVLTVLRTAGAPPAKSAEVLRDAAALTGYGTADATMPAGRVAFAQAQVAKSTARPARTGRTAKSA